ncbi:MAG: hypothetical protein A2512_02555 [Deltaproteobacteria bacterium RIFOXYD12_FULL_56_24]|nr:MAG: hypothetical protein A2512_02555 [Deltaproteobacteria bacterium RIFOXYD12_FULL_56_24]
MRFVKTFTMAVVTLLFCARTGIGGEIILSPPLDKNRPARTDNSEKARSYLNEETSETSPPSIVIIPDWEDEGILSPRVLEMPQDNRSKARDYIRNRDPRQGLPTIIIPPAGSRTNPTRDAAEKQRNKARSYLDGWDGAAGIKPGTSIQIGTTVGVAGKDGVIVFDCSTISNVAGRIGDDLQSGNEFIVVINRKNYRARCR